jgi:hypothetical protein
MINPIATACRRLFFEAEQEAKVTTPIACRMRNGTKKGRSPVIGSRNIAQAAPTVRMPKNRGLVSK